MHGMVADPGLERFGVIYPGGREYPLTDAITALPLKEVRNLKLHPKL